MTSVVQIQSSTNTSVEYSLVIEDGTPKSCTCKAFQFSRSKCKHMQEYTRHRAAQEIDNWNSVTLEESNYRKSRIVMKLCGIESKLEQLEARQKSILQALASVCQGINTISQHTVSNNQYMKCGN